MEHLISRWPREWNLLPSLTAKWFPVSATESTGSSSYCFRKALVSPWKSDRSRSDTWVFHRGAASLIVPDPQSSFLPGPGNRASGESILLSKFPHEWKTLNAAPQHWQVALHWWWSPGEFCFASNHQPAHLACSTCQLGPLWLSLNLSMRHRAACYGGRASPSPRDSSGLLQWKRTTQKLRLLWSAEALFRLCHSLKGSLWRHARWHLVVETSQRPLLLQQFSCLFML